MTNEYWPPNLPIPNDSIPQRTSDSTGNITAGTGQSRGGSSRFSVPRDGSSTAGLETWNRPHPAGLSLFWKSIDTELEKIRQDMSIDFTRVDKEDLNVWAGYGKELINIHISSTGLAADMRNVVTTGNLKDYTYDLFAKAYDVGNNGDLKWEVGVSYRLREIPYGIYEMYAEGKEIVLFRVRLVNSLLGLTKRICIEDKDGKEIKPSDATDKVHGTLAVRPVSSKGKSKK